MTFDLESIPTKYRVKKGWKIGVILLCIPLVGTGLGLIGYVGIIGAGTLWKTVGMIGLGLSLVLFFGYVCIDTLVYTVCIETDKLRIRRAGVRYERRFQDIEGYRQWTNNGILSIKLTSKQFFAVTVNSALENFSELAHFIQVHFKDLDVKEMEESKAAILQNTALGFSEEERMQKLQKAKKVAWVLNGMGIAIAISMFGAFHGYYPVLATAANVIYIGILIAVVYTSNGLIRFSDKKNSLYPSVFIGFFGVGMALALGGLFTDIPDKTHVWPAFGSIWVIVSLVVLLQLWKETKSNLGMLIFNMILFLLLLAGYAYGSVVVPNRVLDTSEPVYYQAQVQDKHISNGKTTTYYLHLSPWGPQQEKEQVSVSGSFYDNTEIGDTVVIVYQKGRFGIPWFYVRDK